MAKPLPTICGNSEIYIPEIDCSECDRLQQQIDELNSKLDEKVEEINTRIDTEVETLNTTITQLRTDMETCCQEVKDSITELTEKVTENTNNITDLSDRLTSIQDIFNRYEDIQIIKTNDDGTIDVVHVLGYIEQNPEPPSQDPYFDGIEDTTINVGDSFDPREGITAYDTDGNEIQYTIEGEVDTEVAGEYTLIYTATDSEGRTTTELREVIVVDNPIKWTGLDELTVEVGQYFNPLSGVSAIGCNDQPATVTVINSDGAIDVAIDDTPTGNESEGE